MSNILFLRLEKHYLKKERFEKMLTLIFMWYHFIDLLHDAIYYIRIFLINRFSRFQFIDLTVLLWLRHMLLFSVFTRAGSSSGLILAQSFNSPLDARYGYSSDSIQLYYFLLFLFKFRFSGVENHDFACVTRHQPTTW